MVSWYRRFVFDCASRTEPATRLLRTSRRWAWGEEREKAFQDLKNALMTAPTLTCPDFRIPFCFQSNASATCLGAVLTQTTDDKEYVIAYGSGVFTSAERNYSVTERVCLAVVWSVEKCREYLESSRFTEITEHSSLHWLWNLKDLSGRIARWVLSLQEYNFEMIHYKGALHNVPNALSRICEEEEVSAIGESTGPCYLRRVKEVEAQSI